MPQELYCKTCQAQRPRWQGIDEFLRTHKGKKHEVVWINPVNGEVFAEAI